MCRQHLPVCVDGNALVLGLFQQQLEVFQVVSGNYNKRAGIDLHGYLGRFRCAVGFRVQQCHTAKVDFSQLQHFRQQFLHGQIQPDLHQCFIEELIYRVVCITQHHSMIGIGCHATQSEQQQRFQRTDVFFRLPQLFHVVIFVSAAGRCTDGTPGNHSALFPMHAVYLCLNPVVVKIDIGQSHKHALDHQRICLFYNKIFIAVHGSR